MILKMSLDKAAVQLGLSLETDIADVSTAGGIPCDAIFTSEELAENLKSNVKCPIYAVKHYLDINSVKAVLELFLRDREGD